jgi:hypothetical protein
MRQTEDQRKVLAEVLLILRQIQTVCFDEDKKTAWTMPSDLREWNNQWTTLWIDARCERVIEDQDPPSGSGSLRLGRWISNREAEGWTFQWPVAEGKLEDMKAEMSRLGLMAHAKEPGSKALKEDWATALGRAQAIGRLCGASAAAAI